MIIDFPVHVASDNTFIFSKFQPYRQIRYTTVDKKSGFSADKQTEI